MDFIAELTKREQQLTQAKEAYEQARFQAQLDCPHPKIVEGKYKSNPFRGNGHVPPFRVCRDCGYAEQGWGAGYSFLTKGYEEDKLEMPVTDRDTAGKFIRGRMVANSDHINCRLGKKSLKDLVKE